jgi:hypothetical protein
MAAETNAVTVTTKPWYLSKTHWTAVVIALVAVLGAPEIIDVLGPLVGMKTLGAVAAFLMIVLRMFSGAPISNSPADTSKD